MTREETKKARWSPLVLIHDETGRRHLLDGGVVNENEILELQARDFAEDDEGYYPIPLDEGVRVQYFSDLKRDPSPAATIHIFVGGYEFVTRVRGWMSFRRPPVKP